jgi:hypothetical protein
MKIINNFRVKVKSREVMGDYIALHGLVPQNELPEHLRLKIPDNEIWMRRDIYDNKRERNKVLQHEECELTLMTNKDMTYKEAHAVATLAEETKDFSVCK